MERAVPINSPDTDREDAIPASDDMLAAEKELETALVSFFEQATVGPVIAGIHSAGYAEDGKTFLVICDGAATRRSVVWSFTPGEPVTPQFY